MIVYHGSTIPIMVPEILKSERKLDFGEGFYTTFNRQQAFRWSERVAARRNTNVRVVTEYEFDLATAERELQIIRFEKPDEAWLDFISANRNGRVLSEAYDIVIGPVADDTVYTTVLLYEQGILDKETAIKQLKVQNLYNQVLFHTKRSLRFCQYVRHEGVEG